jgi:cytochrome c peroxidase
LAATCHHPAAKFADPENRFKPFLLPVSDGSVPTLFGGRNAPTAAYTKFSPPLFWDGELSWPSLNSKNHMC